MTHTVIILIYVFLTYTLTYTKCNWNRSMHKNCDKLFKSRAYKSICRE